MQNTKQSVQTIGDQVFFTEQQAASILCQSVRTLQKWRTIDQGPAIHKFGRSVRYSRADLLLWVESCRTAPTSTTQPPRSSGRVSDRQESSVRER